MTKILKQESCLHRIGVSYVHNDYVPNAQFRRCKAYLTGGYKTRDDPIWTLNQKLIWLIARARPGDPMKIHDDPCLLFGSRFNQVKYLAKISNLYNAA